MNKGRWFKKFLRNFQWWEFCLLFSDVLAIIVIIWVVFECLPYINCSLDDKKIEKVNGFFVDISIGLIVSSFVYFLTVKVPIILKQRFVEKTFSGRLKMIAYCMQVIFAYFFWRKDKSYELQIIPLKNLDLTCFDSLGYLSTEKIGEFWLRCPANSVSVTNLSGSTELGIIHEYLEKIKLFADKITKEAMYLDENKHIYKLVFEINSLSVIRDVEFLYLNRDKTNKMSISNLSDGFRDLYQSYIKLLAYIDIQDISVMGEKDINSVPIIYS